jgi:creatinine amidohydrolase
MRLQHVLPHQFRKAIEEGWPLLIPAGCIEYHGPHMALGLDTLIVEELLERVSARLNSIVAPPFWYGPTGSAVTGPTQGTLDVSTERFGRHAKDVLNSFWNMGFKWIIVCIHHQGLDGPEALCLRQSASEVIFERSLQERGDGWWGKAPLPPEDKIFERIQVWPSVLPDAVAKGVVMADHAGYYETSLLMAAYPKLVQFDKLSSDAPWYCGEAKKSSPEAGNIMWKAMVDAWVQNLTQLVHPQRPTPKDVTIQGLFG